MALAALVPALIAERAETAFVIGFGTGITAGYLAELAPMRSVTVAEISPRRAERGAALRCVNNGASHHPKIELVRSDAYRALLRRSERFDVIVSEPSNPWAAGVEMLFSREFLRAARDRPRPGACICSGITSTRTTSSVELVLPDLRRGLRSRGGVALAIHRSAADRAADPPGEIDLVKSSGARHSPTCAGLARLGIEDVAQVLVHESLPIGVVHAGGPSGRPAHTLYHPRLSYDAGRGFFVGELAQLPFLGIGRAAQVGTRNSLLRRYLDRFAGNPPDAVWNRLIERACAVSLPQCPTLVAAWARGKPREVVNARLAELRSHHRETARLELVPLLRFFFMEPAADIAGGPPDALMRHVEVFRNRYYHALPFPPGSLVALWKHCDQRGKFGPGCQRGLREAGLAGTV